MLLKPDSGVGAENIAVRFVVYVVASTKHTNHQPLIKTLAEIDLGAASAPVHKIITINTFKNYHTLLKNSLPERIVQCHLKLCFPQ